MHMGVLNTKGVASNSLPQVPIVSTNMRKDIVAGRHVNLAALLCPNAPEATCRELVLGESTIALKSTRDNRLNRDLNIQEFIQAFTIFKQIMCQVYPSRLPELDIYLNNIISMSAQFPGPLFYEYHKQFSARAAQFLHESGIKLDWAIRDEHLFVTIFTGQRTNSCTRCQSASQAAEFCPRAKVNDQRHERGSGEDIQGRRVVHHAGKQICNNFNTHGCKQRTNCARLHICLTCKKQHPQAQCYGQ